MEILATFFRQTGSGNYKMAATKMEVLISQLVDLIRMRFQWLSLCFRVQQSNGTTENKIPASRKWKIQDGGH